MNIHETIIFIHIHIFDSSLPSQRHAKGTLGTDLLRLLHKLTHFLLVA